MRWSEVDTTAALWTIPAERTKAKKVHRVPLSVRALSIVRGTWGDAGERIRISGQGSRQVSFEFRLPYAPAPIGRTDITAHGFGSAFRDWAGNETHFPRDLAEAALGHAVGDSTELAYRRGDALEKRRAMMEAWAQWCEPRDHQYPAVPQRGLTRRQQSTPADRDAVSTFTRAIQLLERARAARLHEQTRSALGCVAGIAWKRWLKSPARGCSTHKSPLTIFLPISKARRPSSGP